MIATEFIEHKKNGGEHHPDDIRTFIMEYVADQVPDYQMAAWLMAVNFRGMSDAETIALVDTMLHSGDVVDLSMIPAFKVDKHSTGGVGDKVSLILAPLAVRLGCVVPMISGRGLGHSGGTLDKLESIPGFNVNLSKAEFIRLMQTYGLAMCGQTREICPADRKMYALRDVTSTVKSIPLICGSILSKKIAEGIDGLVLDVKTGNGAFLSEYNQSQQLARQLQSVGQHFGLKVKAVISDMNQPLGRWIGNWLEVREAIEILQGGGAEDLTAVTVYLTAWMLILAGRESSFEAACAVCRRSLASGDALDTFRMMVANQGGDVRIVDQPGRHPQAAWIKPVLSDRAGYVHAIQTREIGQLTVELGAGRMTIHDRIRPEVGLEVIKKIGDQVAPNEALAVIHAADEASWWRAADRLREAYQIRETRSTPPPLFYETF